MRRMLKARLPSVPFEGLAGGKQFLSALDTISTLESANYFSLAPSQRTPFVGNTPSKVDCWPADLLRMLDPGSLRHCPLRSLHSSTSIPLVKFSWFNFIIFSIELDWLPHFLPSVNE